MFVVNTQPERAAFSSHKIRRLLTIFVGIVEKSDWALRNSLAALL
jgi:hypothetical protein